MLSIIMPVYNKSEYLSDAVNSVLNQTHRCFELILVDDGSTDGSGELCEALAQLDSRIRVVHQKNAGVAAARNVGLDMACGEYIAWVDSDDLVHPEIFEIMLGLMDRYNADIAQCNHTRDPDQLHKIMGKIEVLSNTDSLKRIYHSNYTNACSLCSKVYRATIFDSLRFTEGAAFEDDELVPLLLERSRKTVFCEANLYCYIPREGSIITAPKVENIMALTGHLEKRMLRFERLEEELYNLGRKHLFCYLKGKACEKRFWNTSVQEQAIELIIKHRNRFWKIAHRYDRAAILMLCLGWKNIVIDNDFEPIQKIIRKVKSIK